tara:strand:- start:259 stop:474 length:216 start_codon:yes stop_codon:yes gene_type:complete
VKQLVFALMLETIVDGYVDKIEEFGVFENIDHCIYFARRLTLQGNVDYEIPYKSYCIPKYVNPEATVIYKR